MNALSVRELSADFIPHIVSYWVKSSDDHLLAMGADPKKVPSQDQFSEALNAQLETPYEGKQSYALIWFADGEPIGHSNVNKIQFGKEAFMHLHLWESKTRASGRGRQLVIRSLPFFFENLQLERLFCEPYAKNEAPNRTLASVGFSFEKEYTTIPGSINFEQPVKRWGLHREQYQKLGYQHPSAS